MPAELVGASYRCSTCGQELAEECGVISGTEKTCGFDPSISAARTVGVRYTVGVLHHSFSRCEHRLDRWVLSLQLLSRAYIVIIASSLMLRKRHFQPIVPELQAASLLPASDSRMVPCSGITARSCEVAGKTTLQFSHLCLGSRVWLEGKTEPSPGACPTVLFSSVLVHESKANPSSSIPSLAASSWSWWRRLLPEPPRK